MASGCRNPMSICAARFTRLNANGSPVSGNSAGAVTLVGGIGSAKWTADIIAGEKVRELDGCGGLSVNRRYADRLAAFDLEIDMLVRSYELQELTTDATLISSSGSVIGVADLVQTSCGAATAKNGVVVELWGENFECSQLDATFPYHRVVFARAKFNPSDGNMSRGANHLVLKGFAEVNDSLGNGPFNDIVGWPTSAIRATYEDTALPTASVDCGYITTPSQS